MEIDRIWEMPNSKTFKVNAIKEFICNNIIGNNLIIIDPFANEHSIKESLLNHNYISNDLDKDYDCDYNLDALDFLKLFTIVLMLYCLTHLILVGKSVNVIKN